MEALMLTNVKIPFLCLKADVPYALYKGERVALSSAPRIEDGIFMLPKDAVKLLGMESSSEYTPSNAIDGFFKVYEGMGLLYLDNENSEKLDVQTDKVAILTIAHSFIFDVKVPQLADDYAPATDTEREGFIRVGNELCDILRKRGNTHPFVFGTQDIFDRLRDIYSKKEGELYGYIDALVKRADKYLEYFPALNENGDGLVSEIPETGYGESEYDVGGRHSHSEGRLNELAHVAFAYQMTQDERYARLAYYCALGVINRLHWGPGHFLNCSGAAGRLVMVYDWLYNAWKSLKLDTGAIKRGIYTQGLHHGYNSAIYDSCDFPSPKQGTGWRFKLKPDNWNSVCNSGMILGSLCLLAEDPDGAVNAEEYEKIKELLGACITSTMQPSLVFTQYAPDGSYVESNSYWAYGTTNLVSTMSALYDSLGTDLGLHNACGFDKTCYYAINTESADFVGWNYHDGGLGGQDTSCFNQIATISGDLALYAIREDQLKRGKGVSLFDLIYHPAVRGKSIPALSSLPHDYAMTGIDAFTVRSGWESGSLFAGIIGGANPSGGSHNQLDSGAFVYHNLGKLWFTDLGSDYYNSVGIDNGLGYFSNYALYRRNAEGNNTLCLRSLPYGQLMSGRGVMSEVFSSDKKSYAIIDNETVYGSDKVKYARRGMLLTNNRRTLVIKDEVEFTATESAFSTAHFESDKISAKVAEDGKGCVLTHKDGEKIYVTLLGDGILELTDCEKGLLDGTAPAHGELSRENYGRIVVKYDNVKSINSALVIDTEDVGFSLLCGVETWKTL